MREAVIRLEAVRMLQRRSGVRPVASQPVKRDVTRLWRALP
jgi:hypothetical protein